MPHMSLRRGRSLPFHEGGRTVQRVEVLGDELGFGNLELELALQEPDELQHPERVQYALPQEGCVGGEPLDEKVLGDEAPDPFPHVHRGFTLIHVRTSGRPLARAPPDRG